MRACLCNVAFLCHPVGARGSQSGRVGDQRQRSEDARGMNGTWLVPRTVSLCLRACEAMMGARGLEDMWDPKWRDLVLECDTT